MSKLECRFCSTPLHRTFVDLGSSPLANSYLEPAQLAEPEPFYPLHTWVCDWCHLVQLPEIADPEAIFSDYAYFSSYSDSWLRHAEDYAAAMTERFGLTAASQVVEVASNDGYLLRFFKEREVPVLGIEPARNVAAAAEKIGIPTRVEFFGEELARRLVAEGIGADLVVGNNVLAHTPHLNDFVAGLKIVLKPQGVITLEFPHLQQLIEHNQFDTIYHEHFSYFSFTVVRKVLGSHALAVFDVEELPTHGGSLRVFAGHAGDGERPAGERVDELLSREERLGYSTEEPYRWFGERVKATKRRLLYFLMRVKDTGKRIAGYGAPAKGNTLLNYCGIRTDFLDYTVDISPHKQGLYLPGTHIPIHGPDHLREHRPDYVLILPWNIQDEIMEQMSDVRGWGGQFVVAIPEVKVFE
ncbi:MAG: class I SAM-dependent methyltransferase [bacterium]|nr:class I SAM-dependent methyltransferase [bacterium]